MGNSPWAESPGPGPLLVNSPAPAVQPWREVTPTPRGICLLYHVPPRCSGGPDVLQGLWNGKAQGRWPCCDPVRVACDNRPALPFCTQTQGKAGGPPPSKPRHLLCLPSCSGGSGTQTAASSQGRESLPGLRSHPLDSTRLLGQGANSQELGVRRHQFRRCFNFCFLFISPQGTGVFSLGLLFLPFGTGTGTPSQTEGSDVKLPASIQVALSAPQATSRLPRSQEST